MTPKFKVGDEVRITTKRESFRKVIMRDEQKKFIQFRKSVTLNMQITYKIADYNNEVIKRTFYEQMLQKATELFRIKNVVKKKGNKSLVK